MLIEAAVKRADPDLVVLTGDQIRGYDPAFERTYVNRRGDAPGAPLPPGVRTEAKMARVGKCVRGLLHRHNTGAASDPVEEEDTETKVMRCLSGFLGPIVSRGIPFAVTYGNHDFQCGVPLERQDELYRAFDGCLNPVDSLEPGTFGLTIDAHDGRQTAMGVMMVNSGDFAADGGYGSPSDDAVAWLGDVVKDVGAPSVVFQHIPPPEIYDCLVPVGRFTTNAIRGYRAHSGTCYVLDQEHSKPGSALREHPCCSEHNSGEVRAMKTRAGISPCSVATTTPTRSSPIMMGLTWVTRQRVDSPHTDRVARTMHCGCLNSTRATPHPTPPNCSTTATCLAGCPRGPCSTLSVTVRCAMPAA